MVTNLWLAQEVAKCHRQDLLDQAEADRRAGARPRGRAAELLGRLLVRAGRWLMGPVGEVATAPVPRAAVTRMSNDQTGLAQA